MDFIYKFIRTFQGLNIFTGELFPKKMPILRGLVESKKRTIRDT